MPVTTRPSPSKVGRNADEEIAFEDDESIFGAVTSGCRSPYKEDSRQSSPTSSTPEIPLFGTGFDGLPIIASSINPKSTSNGESTEGTVSIYDNGFVNGVIRAFNQDLHLVIRPDDVWQAILLQFSLFVNGNAESLRKMFVTHEGKRVVTVEFTPDPISGLDFGKVAQTFASTIQEKVIDAELREWMIPDFSTTTEHDKAVAAFGMMGAMKEYFKYQLIAGCGLPSVTLLGSRSDWEKLGNRIHKLHKYGEECSRWAGLLQPIIRYMLKTFDESDSQEVKDFWLRVAYEAGREGSGSGICTLSGWITAFAYFRDDGRVTWDYKEEEISQMYEEKSTRSPACSPDEDRNEDRKRLVLDGVSYPLIRLNALPRAIVLLPMTIIDLEANVKIFATAISGIIGMSISENGTTAQPVSAWWVVEEFEEPIKVSAANIRAALSVAGSSADGTSNDCLSSADVLSSDEEMGLDEDFDDEDFDDEALP
ncbi:hypothetical protein V8C40DRAFT_237738 [Trichoderma camerunense]